MKGQGSTAHYAEQFREVIQHSELSPTHHDYGVSSFEFKRFHRYRVTIENLSAQEQLRKKGLLNNAPLSETERLRAALELVADRGVSAIEAYRTIMEVLGREQA